MDSFEWNKIFGAVLGTVLFIVALYIGVEGLMAPHQAEKPGMEIAIVEDHGANGGPATAELPPDWGTMLPAADVAAGETVHKRCLQCHDFENGGPNKIGPNLWNVVGGKHAHAAGFVYSAALQALAEKTWGYDELDAFLKNPKAAVPGTKMSFAGLSKQQDRVNLIAFLRTRSATPFAIPAPNPVAPAAPSEGTPVDGATGETPAGELQAPPPGETPVPAPPGAAPPVAPAPGGTTTPAAATPATTTPAPAATTPAPDGH